MRTAVPSPAGRRARPPSLDVPTGNKISCSDEGTLYDRYAAYLGRGGRATLPVLHGGFVTLGGALQCLTCLPLL
jgi:hypothetical protein